LEGTKIALLSFGSMLTEAQQSAKSLGATLVDMRFIKPLDTNLIAQLTETHDVIVTVEDNAIAGGAGSAVNEFILTQGTTGVKVLNIGIPDQFVKHGTQEEVHHELALDSEGITAKVELFLAL